MDYCDLIVEAGKKMLHSNLTVETWGNISYRDTKEDLIYITPSGMNYDTMTLLDVVTCDYSGNIIKGDRKPSVEKELHIKIYNERKDINAIIHTHPIYSLVFASLGEDIPLFIDEAAQTLGDTVRVAEYALPGTKELAENCFKALGSKANACLLKSHGAVCCGRDMDAAFKVAKVLEMTAQVYQMARVIGKPQLLSEANILAMQEFVRESYGQRK